MIVLLGRELQDGRDVLGFQFTHFRAAEELKFARQRRTGTAGPRRL